MNSPIWNWTKNSVIRNPCARRWPFPFPHCPHTWFPKVKKKKIFLIRCGWSRIMQFSPSLPDYTNTREHVCLEIVSSLKVILIIPNWNIQKLKTFESEVGDHPGDRAVLNLTPSFLTNWKLTDCNLHNIVNSNPMKLKKKKVNVTLAFLWGLRCYLG